MLSPNYVTRTCKKGMGTRTSHNLGKALGEGLGLLCAPFTSLSLPLAYLMDVLVLVQDVDHD